MSYSPLHDRLRQIQQERLKLDTETWEIQLSAEYRVEVRRECEKLGHDMGETDLRLGAATRKMDLALRAKGL